MSIPTIDWPVGVALRPPVDPAVPGVEVADAVTGRRFRCQPEALAAAILAGTVPAPIDSLPDRSHLVAGWQHWYRRGWHPSDSAYVASRRRTPVAAGDGSPPAELLPDGPVVALGPTAEPGDQPISRLLRRRRSGRAYVPEPVPLPSLSGLLWYGMSRIRRRRVRAAEGDPRSLLESFGSAWDIALTVYGVDGVAPGAYRYDLGRHELRLVRPGDHRTAMIDVLQGMHSPATAAWTLALVADFPRYQWLHRHEDGLRRLWIEAGTIAQELLLLASSYGISTLVTPAQKDRPYLKLHDLDDRRYSCLYTLTQGLARGRGGVELPVPARTAASR